MKEATVGAPRTSIAQAQPKVVGIWGAVAQAAALIGPAVGLTAGNIFLAGFAGFASPFVFLTALIFCVALASIIGSYARQISNAGSFYAYLSSTFGVVPGFVTGIMQVSAYILLLVFQPPFFGSFMAGSLPGLGIPWEAYACGIMLFSTVLTYLGVQPTLRVGLALLSFELTIFTILGALILLKGGAHGLSLQPFNPSASLQGTSGILLGNVFTIFAFVGFESATTLGEEVRDAKRALPRAVMLTTFVIGVFYVVLTYAEVVGFGLTDDGLNQLKTNPSPFAALATTFAGPWLADLVIAATMLSVVALNLVTVNASSRMLFALARDGFGHGALARTNRFHAPGAAAIVSGVVPLIAVLVLGGVYGSDNLATWASFFATLFFIGAYAALVVGLPVYYFKRHRQSFSVFKHMVVPAIGMLGILLVTYGNIYPLPDAPLRYFIYATILVIVLATAVGKNIQRRDPERLRRIAEDLALSHPTE